jgi:hypothetical protein
VVGGGNDKEASEKWQRVLCLLRGLEAEFKKGAIEENNSTAVGNLGRNPWGCSQQRRSSHLRSR